MIKFMITALGALLLGSSAFGGCQLGPNPATGQLTCLTGGTGATGSGAGASAVADLTDCKVVKTSATVATINPCNFKRLGSDGRYTITAIAGATWTITGGSDGGTAAFEIDPSSGSPVINCIYGPGMSASNYTPSGCTEVSGSAYTVGALPLGQLTVSGGNWDTVTDHRAAFDVTSYTANTCLTKTGNVFSFDAAGCSPTWGSPHSSDSTYNYCAPSGASGTTYACSISPAITAYGTGVHYFFKADVANTGSATINFNSLGAKTIKKFAGGSANLAANDIRAGQIVEVAYDGTDMQLVNQLGNASGGTPGGSSGQIQFNSSGAFGGDSGLTWDNTNKLLTVTRNGNGGAGGVIRLMNSSTNLVSEYSAVNACIGNDTNECLWMTKQYANLDGSGSSFWGSLVNVVAGNLYYLVSRRGGNEINIGGAVGTPVGYLAVTSTGVSRFGNAATAGRGLASIQGAPTELTGQTGDLTGQTLLASSHTAGMYRVCGFVAVTATGTGNTAAWTLAWRSPASGTDLTHNLFFSSGAAETDTFSVASANEFNVCKVIRSAGTSAIVLDPGDMNTATYTTAWTVERLR